MINKEDIKKLWHLFEVEILINKVSVIEAKELLTIGKKLDIMLLIKKNLEQMEREKSG